MSVATSYFSSSAPPLTIAEAQSIAGSTRQVFGMHPAESSAGSSTLGVWRQTEPKGDEDMIAQQVEKFFQANERTLRIVYQWEASQFVDGEARIQAFWAVVSALDENGYPEAANLTVRCEVSYLTGVRRFYGPGVGIAAGTDWILAVEDHSAYRASPLVKSRSMGENMTTALGNLLDDGYDYALSNRAVMPSFAGHIDVNSALRDASTEVVGLDQLVSRLRARLVM